MPGASDPGFDTLALHAGTAPDPGAYEALPGSPVCSSAGSSTGQSRM